MHIGLVYFIYPSKTGMQLWQFSGRQCTRSALFICCDAPTIAVKSSTSIIMRNDVMWSPLNYFTRNLRSLWQAIKFCVRAACWVCWDSRSYVLVPLYELRSFFTCYWSYVATWLLLFLCSLPWFQPCFFNGLNAWLPVSLYYNSYFICWHPTNITGSHWLGMQRPTPSW